MSITYQEAVAYSHNYATAKPDIGATEKEHILGLCKVLEQVGAERDALAKRLNDEGVSHDNTMTQRDYAEEMAGKAILAGADKLREHQSTTTAGHAGR